MLGVYVLQKVHALRLDPRRSSQRYFGCWCRCLRCWIGGEVGVGTQLLYDPDNHRYTFSMNKNLTIMLASGAIILLGLFFYWLQGESAVDSVTEFPSETTSETTPAIPAPTDQPAIEEPVADLPVTPSPLEPIVASKACYVGGCSGQVCSSEEGVITNCLYQEAYACYQQATCERQTTGECGWTLSPTLLACIAASAEDGPFEEAR